MITNSRSDDNHLGFNTMQEERLMVILEESCLHLQGDRIMPRYTL